MMGLVQSPTTTWLIQCPTTMWQIHSPLRCGIAKARCYTAFLKPIATRHLKARCYTALLKPVGTRHHLLKPLLHGNTLQNLKIIFLQSPNTILATIYKKTQILKSTSTILGNILPKAQILVGQNFTNTQKPKYYFGNYF